MRLLGNIWWYIPCMGFLTAFGVFLLGILFSISIVGAPIGAGLIQYSKFLLAPFSSEMVSKEDLNIRQNGLWKLYSFVVRIVYFPFGLFFFLVALFQIIAAAVTIVGIPVALILVKSLCVFFNPVGKVCVPHVIGDELRRRQDQATKDQYLGKH